MISTYMNRLTNGWPSLILLFVALAMTITCAQTQAALGDIGFQIQISEKEMVLKNPDDMDMMKFEMWDTPYQRIQNRNRPWIKVTNMEDSTGNLTEFSITIGDMDYKYTDEEYGELALLSNYSEATSITASSPTGDELFVNIGNGGLAPGETVLFGIELAPDTQSPDVFALPDFRLVLFDMNNMDNNGISDNAIASATFVDPGDPSMVAMLSTQLEDYEVTGNQSLYYNNVLRPYSVMEGIDIFGSGVSTNVIPEPSTYAMFTIGILGALIWHRSRR